MANANHTKIPDSLPPRSNINDLLKSYLMLFKQWATEVPHAIIAAGAENASNNRRPMCAFLERRWRKLHQDLDGALNLLSTNHIGPAAVLSRVIRENAVEMLVCAFDNPSNDSGNLDYFLNQRECENARRFKNQCERFLNCKKDENEVLQKALDYADDILSRQQPHAESQKTNLPKGFARLTELSISLLENTGVNAHTLKQLVVDYWMESEAVHAGPNAENHYQPTTYTGDVNYDTAVTSLSGIRDIYPAKLLVTGSLLQAAGLLRRVSLPPVARQLEDVAERAEQLIHAVNEKCNQADGTDH